MSLLKIEPENELIFRGPFNEPVSVVMKLSNNGEKPVAFKIKVTELGFKYHVTPFQGVLGQKEAVPIQVTLMPFDPNVNRKQDKIKVLSVLAPEGDFKIKNLWKESTLEVHEWKLKCVLEIPDVEGSSAATPAVSVNSSAKSQPEADFIECQVCVFEPHPHQGPLVKFNKSQVYFGGARIGQTPKQNVVQLIVVRNESHTQALGLEVCIKGSNDFFVSGENRSLVSRRNFQLEPRQECPLELVFQPHSLGPLTAKLNLYPRCESAKQVKYTVNLFGYGGSSHIQQLAHITNGPEQTLAPKFKGTFWNCQLVLENRGNVAGFAFIQPLQENGKVMESSDQCIVFPQCCLVNAGDFKRIQIHIHPSKNGTSLKLRLVWGDEPLRARWIRCIANGTPIKPTSEIDWAISSMLLQLECNEDNNSSSPDISEEDMALFFNNTIVEEIGVVIPEQGQKCQS